MSDTEAEPFQLDLLLEPVRANLQTPQVATSSSRGRSRKRNADEAASEVPSVSRRRRIATADTAFMQASYPPACCIDGIVQPGPCLLQPAQTYQPGSTMAALNSLPPVYRPQVIAPQIHAQMAAMPSTSSVNSVAPPISLHVQSPPGISINYPTPVQLSQAHDPVYYVSSEQAPTNSIRLSTQPTQRITQPIMSQRPPLSSVIYAPNIPEPERVNPRLVTEPVAAPGQQEIAEIAYLRQLRRDWESAIFAPGTQHRWTTTVREPNSRVEMLISRVRQAAAQAAAVAAAQAVDTTAMLLATQAQDRAMSQARFIDGLDLNVVNPPVEMANAIRIPQLPREWATRGVSYPDNTAPQSQPPDPTDGLNTESPFRTWEAAFLHIFDRVAPSMNLIRMQPKGMPKNEIDQLQSFRLANPKSLNEKVCVICQCDFEKKDHVRVLPCEHHFHLKCIDKWLKTNRTCPICRKNASETVEPPTVTTSAVASMPASPHIAVQVFTQLSGNQRASPNPAGTAL